MSRPLARSPSVAGFGLAFIVAAALLAGRACAADPDALWKIVHDKCAPGQAARGDPSPCLAVDLAGGFAVLKDRRGATQVLVIPTARVTGIESPELTQPHAPNYWEDAWRSRGFVEHLAGKPIPRDDLALAVNSADGRSQNQLHIHVDCLSPAAKSAIAAAAGRIGAAWTPFDAGVAGRRYLARRVEGAELTGADPFRLLDDGHAAARADMGLETLVVVPWAFADGPGFVLLSDRADPARGDYGSGEELMDHACRVLDGDRGAAPPPA